MAANYTLTGNFQQLTGVSDATGQLIIQLCNYGNQTPRATGVIITTGPITVTCVAGAFTVTFWGNDQITPSGTFYTVRILTSKGQLVSDTSYQFQGGGSNDLSTLTPIASTPPVPVTTYAPINSPAFTGIPTAPTATVGTNTTQLATTAFVTAATGTSSSVSVPTAGGASPTPVYNADRETPVGVNPAIYVQDGAGNWHPQAGIDTTTVDVAGSGPSVPAGILTWDRIQYYRDTLTDTQPGKNAFMSIAHQAGAGTSWNNQDRSMWITMTNVTGAVTNFSITGNVVTLTVNNLVNGILGVGKVGFRKGQRIQVAGLSTGTYLNAVPLTILTTTAISGSSTTAFQTITASDAGFTHANVGSTADAGTIDQLLYAMENLQMEQDVVGTPVTVAAVDGEYSTLSVQMSDKHKGLISAPNLGCNAIRAQYFREATSGTWGSVQPSAGKFIVQDNATGGDPLEFVNGVVIQGSNSGACPDLYIALNLPVPATRFLGGNYGAFIGNFGSNPNDYALYVTGGQSFFGGVVGLTSFYGTTGTIVASAPFEAASLKSDALATPFTLTSGQFTVLGTPGAASVTYVLVYRDANGNGVSSNAFTVTTANATLNSSNSIFFNTGNGNIPLGPASVELWRTAGGPSQGKIATYSIPGNVTSANLGQFTFNDIGVAATAGTLPVGNATGSIAAAGPISGGSYTVANLPPGVAGQMAFATNGRKVGEGAGSGTGVPVYFSNTLWRVFSTDAQVTS